MPSLELTIADYRWKQLDAVVEQASHEFLSNDNFVKSKAFYQFAWRTNIENFEERCKRGRQNI